MNKYVTLAHGGGGSESEELISIFQKELKQNSDWQNQNDDGATTTTDKFKNKKLVFTTDSFIINPLFFNGGDIGKIAACGTINDLTVMGGKPLGLSLSLIIEEGFPIANLEKIIKSLAMVCQKEKVPVVTGDTKVMEKGKLDKIMINTSGVGIAEKVIADSGLQLGNLICSDGTLGDHGSVILANRFNYKTNLKSDSGTFVNGFLKIINYITSAKDPTRGGLSQCLNEMAEKSKVKIIIDENTKIFKKESLAISGLLGISEYSLPSEGRFVFGIKKNDLNKVKSIFKQLKKDLLVFGEVKKGQGVVIKTKFGERPLEKPQGKLIPRIC
jgi:hydrogenase expression/formation protein HypE